MSHTVAHMVTRAYCLYDLRVESDENDHYWKNVQFELIINNLLIFVSWAVK